jgi:hypothetical protein
MVPLPKLNETELSARCPKLLHAGKKGPGDA